MRDGDPKARGWVGARCACTWSREAEPPHLAKGWKTLEVSKLNMFPGTINSLMRCVIFLDRSLSY